MDDELYVAFDAKVTSVARLTISQRRNCSNGRRSECTGSFADKPSRAKIHRCPLLSESGQTRAGSDCPLCANSGHSRNYLREQKDPARRSLRNLKQRLRECRPRKSLNYGQNELMCVLQLQSRRPTGQVTSKRYFKAKCLKCFLAWQSPLPYEYSLRRKDR
jgi:hypothetical protein